jgi:membrane fusion protein (multidrug efflux system)
LLYFSIVVNETASSVPRKIRVAGVEVAIAKLGLVRQQVEAVGSTLARQAIDVVSLVSGRVVEIAFTPGQKVITGDILVRLDNGAQRAQVDEAAAAVEEVMLSVERARRLKVSGTVTQAAIDKLETVIKAKLARFALMKKQLADRIIHAPFDGVVGLRQIHVGARVDSDTVLTTLDDLTEIEINFAIPEIHFARLHLGQKVTATSLAFRDKVFGGQITSIDTRIQEVSRSFRVRAVLPNPGGELPAGMFMHVSILIGEDQVILVPEEAIIAEGEHTFVYTVKDEIAKRRNVTLGQRSEGKVAVVEGVAIGEMVVRLGHQRLRDGSKVRIKKPGNKTKEIAKGVSS